MKMKKIFLTTTEVAEMLGVSGQTVRNLIRCGIIRSYRLNPSGRLLIRQEDFEKAIITASISKKEEENNA